MNIKRKQIILLLILVSTLSTIISALLLSNLNLKITKEFKKMETTRIKIFNDEGRILEVEVKIADEPEEWAAGFQNISRSIIEKTRILFIFPSEVKVSFHMRNVETSLDIAFIRSDGTIVEIMRMDPDPNRLYIPSESFKYAIEAPTGFFENMKVTARKSKLIFEKSP
ncbi:MAG: DUF192 domain-containing protein [Nitrososphaerota archaeon]|nr:DUF192 domain-containing protein [Nitrososphaerota archaeon]